MLKLRNIRDQLVKKYLMEQLEIPDYKADICVAWGIWEKQFHLQLLEYFNEIKEEAIRLLRNIDEMQVEELMAAVKTVCHISWRFRIIWILLQSGIVMFLLFKATKDPDRVVFSDQLKYNKQRASKSSYEGIEVILEGIEKAKARLNANVNFELTMELLLLTIKEN